MEGIGRGHPEFTPGEPLLCTVDKGQLEVDHGAFQMVYSNAPMGMRHDLIVNDKPSGEGVLEAFLRISGDLLALQVGEGEVVFHCYDVGSMALVPRSVIMDYMWDATGRTPGSKMELRGDQLVLSVQDEHAIYPVTIDPVSSTADLVLPGSQTGRILATVWLPPGM